MTLSEPTAALVIIGAEVLSGKVDDANAPFLIRALRERGVQVVEIRTIGDVVPVIGQTVRELAKQVDHVFTTGGIGPTHDDVTIAGVADAFAVAVVRHPEIEQRLVAYFGARLNAAHLKMAEVPEGAGVLLDEGHVTPVVQMRNVTVLPGVPSLMRTCFARAAKELKGRPFHSRAILLDASESSIAAHLDDVQRQHPDVAIGSYPRFDDAAYRVKVTVDGRDPEIVDAVAAAIRRGIEPGWIVGEEPARG